MSVKEPSPIDKHVGQRVRQKRLLMGISQEKLGEAVGITFQQIQKYEKGTNRIGASRLQQIASVLHVTPDYFFEGTSLESDTREATASDDPIQNMLSTPDGIALARACAKVRSRKQLRCVIALVEAMAGLDGNAAPEAA